MCEIHVLTFKLAFFLPFALTFYLTGSGSLSIHSDFHSGILSVFGSRRAQLPPELTIGIGSRRAASVALEGGGGAGGERKGHICRNLETLTWQVRTN